MKNFYFHGELCRIILAYVRNSSDPIISPNVECDGLANTFFPVVPLLEPFLSDVTSSVYKRRLGAILLTFILGTLPVATKLEI